MLLEILRPWHDRALEAKLHASRVQSVLLAVLHEDVQDLVPIADGMLIFADEAAAEGFHRDVDFVDIGD